MKKYFKWVIRFTIGSYLLIGIGVVMVLSGCSQFEEKLNNQQYYMCDKSESLLLCDSTAHCVGYLE